MPAAKPEVGASARFVLLGRAEREIRSALQSEGPALDEAYALRAYRPLWTDSGGLNARAGAAMQMLRNAADHGLAAEDYLTPDLIAAARLAQSGSPSALARADVRLTQAVHAFILDVRRPSATMLYADAAVRPHAPSIQEVVAGLGSPAGQSELLRMNPEYEALKAALDRARSAGDRGQEQVLRLNLARARSLPQRLGDEYVLVDIAAQELEFWRHGRMADRIPVVVGSTRRPTPAMAGMLRFVVLHPYWHVPPDLAAERIAPAVLETGTDALRRQDLDVVSDFGSAPTLLNAESVDWRAVAAGDSKVYLRQRPGPGNMMGKVKFIFPNRLGVYLHDTPLRNDFGQSRRLASAGCVRLSDAGRLYRRLLGSEGAATTVSPERVVKLPRPVPIYLIYLTARPHGPRVARSDIYGRDGQTAAAHRSGGAGLVDTPASRAVEGRPGRALDQ